MHAAGGAHDIGDGSILATRLHISVHQTADRLILAGLLEDVGDNFPRSVLSLFDIDELVETVADLDRHQLVPVFLPAGAEDDELTVLFEKGAIGQAQGSEFPSLAPAP